MQLSNSSWGRTSAEARTEAALHVQRIETMLLHHSEAGDGELLQSPEKFAAQACLEATLTANVEIV